MVDEQKLRKLSMKAKGWKLDAFNQTADNAEQGLAYVGSRDDEDDRFNDILEIDTGNYYQPEKAVEVAEFITTANPAAILSLLDELQTLREERTAWRVTAENAEKDAERYQWILKQDFNDRQWHDSFEEYEKARADRIDAAIESLKEAA